MPPQRKTRQLKLPQLMTKKKGSTPPMHGNSRPNTREGEPGATPSRGVTAEKPACVAAKEASTAEAEAAPEAPGAAVPEAVVAAGAATKPPTTTDSNKFRVQRSSEREGEAEAEEIDANLAVTAATETAKHRRVSSEAEVVETVAAVEKNGLRRQHRVRTTTKRRFKINDFEKRFHP